MMGIRIMTAHFVTYQGDDGRPLQPLLGVIDEEPTGMWHYYVVYPQPVSTEPEPLWFHQYLEDRRVNAAHKEWDGDSP